MALTQVKKLSRPPPPPTITIGPLKKEKKNHVFLARLIAYLGKSKETHGVFAAEAVEFSVGSSLELDVAAEGLLTLVETSVTVTEAAAADEEQEDVGMGWSVFEVVVVMEDGTPAVCVKLEEAWRFQANSDRMVEVSL